MISILLVALFATAAANAAPADWHPDDIAWQRTNPDGTRFALLEGVRDKPGVPFTYAFFIPAGVWDRPHSHAATAHVLVARGTLALGYGKKLDRARARRFPVGSILLVPAGAVHFDGASEETVIIGTAIGPWSTDYIDHKATPSAGAPSK
jgi:quercetin dioxygenase-like cupin family protein